MDHRDGSDRFGVARADFGVGSSAKRRRMTVAEALKWAWTDELPKETAAHAGALATLAAKSAWSGVLQYGELHSIVDRQPNRFGCIPFDEGGLPHPDAYRLAEAVASLVECTVDVPEGWHPMPWLGEIDPHLGDKALRDAMASATVDGADGLKFRLRPDALVIRFAILGVMPLWRMANVPEVKFEIGANGKPRWFVQRPVTTEVGTYADGSPRFEARTVEVDGWSERLKRPIAGAYRRAYLDPDPVPVMVARAEYEILCAAMAMLADDLAGTLETIDLVPVDWPERPWEAQADSLVTGRIRRQPRILPDLAHRDGVAGVAGKQAKSRRKAKSKSPRKAA